MDAKVDRCLFRDMPRFVMWYVTFRVTWDAPKPEVRWQPIGITLERRHVSLTKRLDNEMISVPIKKKATVFESPQAANTLPIEKAVTVQRNASRLEDRNIHSFFIIFI
ncbi:Hypothetical predicted protein [Pelobates cultripes]|uniref:Uncharacterized protein n=1 Tax=Pelobates cultripes TaxID=61616 RepID=A0AAD1RLM8_PELCU|nr:Hypothetical predicted protein [Pelobates cultripes]